LGEDAAEEMHAGALHSSAGHDRSHGLAESQVSVGDDELPPGQAAGLMRAQELGPEATVLGVANGEAEDLAAAVAAHPGRDDHGLGGHPAVDAGLAVGGVHEHLREGPAGQKAVPEGRHLMVEVGTYPRDLALADAAVGAKGPDQVVDLASAEPVQLRLHHHREQGLVNPAAALQQRGEERPGAQLGMRNSRSPAVVESNLGRCHCPE
jgi:hypothetical protein